jgi:hypothetical protein
MPKYDNDDPLEVRTAATLPTLLAPSSNRTRGGVGVMGTRSLLRVATVELPQIKGCVR